MQVEVMLKWRIADGASVAVAALVDIILLASCDGLIGKFSSNMFRIAYALASVRAPKIPVRRTSPPDAPLVCLPPYVSLDHPWCADHGVLQAKRPLPTQRFLGKPQASGLIRHETVGGIHC